MTENQFWWATVHGFDRPEVVEVTFKDGTPEYVCPAGASCIAAEDLDQHKVRLIERVLPAGRAAAAVEMLEKVSGCYHVEGASVLAEEAIAILQRESQA